MTPKITKIPKVSNFRSFYALLSKIHRLRGLECFKRSTMKKLVGPVVFREEIIQMFQMKMSQFGTKLT